MATKLAIVTGNLTTAGTWVSGDTGTNAVLVSTSTGTTALTTGNLDSATFTLSANAMQYIGIRLGSRAAGSPSNTMTITLVNSTAAGLRVPSAWVINVSDLPACSTTNDEGGWIWLKANATWTPNGTDLYLIRATLSATTTAVSLCTNGTANNWQRIVCRSATGAPAAGDDMHVGGLYSNAASPATTPSTLTVTMDQTAATDYGSNLTTGIRAGSGLNISSRGAVTWGSTATTTYVLQLSGNVINYLNGTFTVPAMPRDSTATLQFDCAADLDFGFVNRGTVSMTGLSRISGSTNPWVLLSADVAAAATTVNTTTQLSGKNGDTVIIGASNGGAGNVDSKTLNADALSSSFTISAGLTNAHSGTAPNVCEAFVVERNVVVKAVTDGLVGYFRSDPTGTTTLDWVRFHAMGTNSTTTAGVTLNPTTGSATMTNCIQDLADGVGLVVPGTATGTISVTQNVTYNCQSSTNGQMVQIDGGAGATITFQHNLIVSTRGSAWGLGMLGLTVACTFSDVRISGINDVGATFQGSFANNTFTDFNIRPQGNLINLSSSRVTDLTFDNLVGWKSANGIVFQIGVNNLTLTNGVIVGIGTGNNACLRFDNAGPHNNIVVNGTRLAGTTGTASDYAVRINAVNCVLVNFNLLNVIYGGSSPYANFATGSISNSTTDVLLIGNAFLNSASQAPTDTLTASTLRIGSHFGVDTTTTKKCYGPNGQVTYETTTVDVSPSFKLTPATAARKLDSACNGLGYGFYVPVDNGSTPTVSIKIQKDASYNGNAARLILKANAGIGVASDTVIGTFSGSSGSFQTVSGVAPAASAAGVMEFVVDCDGTAGNIFGDTFTVSNAGASAVSGLNYWYGGLPC